MKHKSTLALASISLAIATMVSAQEGDIATEDTQVDDAKQSVPMDVDKIVDGRRAAYWMSANLFGGMFGIVNSGGDVTGLAGPARALAGWANALPDMFPEGSVNAKSNALPTVWSEREEFEQLAAEYAERANTLSEIAATGDKDAFKVQWQTVRQSCVTCHDKFRRDRRAEAQAKE